MKKKVFGIVLLVLAALVLLQGNFGYSFTWRADFGPWLVLDFLPINQFEAILRRHFTSASFTALVALMIANHFYDILPIPNQSLFWASILIVMGVSALTHSNRTWNGKKWWYDGEKTILTDKEVAFGTGTFYKQEQELVEDQVEVWFWQCQDILWQCRDFRRYATSESGSWFWQCSYLCSPTLGSWFKVETFCGVAKADTPLVPTSKTLIIRGDVAFGKLGIVYVK